MGIPPPRTVPYKRESTQASQCLSCYSCSLRLASPVYESARQPTMRTRMGEGMRDGFLKPRDDLGGGSQALFRQVAAHCRQAARQCRRPKTSRSRGLFRCRKSFEVQWQILKMLGARSRARPTRIISERICSSHGGCDQPTAPFGMPPGSNQTAELPFWSPLNGSHCTAAPWLFHHHDEQNPALVPPANPANAPAVNVIAQSDGLEQAQELGLDFHGKHG